MPMPFIGRLNVSGRLSRADAARARLLTPARIEYAALVGSFFLVALEAFVRIATLCLPNSLLELLYRASQRLFNRFTSPAQKRAEERKKSISTSIRDAPDFVELCRLFGYTAEEHIFQTKDGYLLGLHRLAWRPGEEALKVNAGPKSLTKRVVYLHHGLLMNSEVWVCITDARRCLPFVLVERGFDVWLGNNRGNKYSKKSIHEAASSLAFWNFSIDEFALHDIPDSIAYVLETTGQRSLSYIGFSQGTAQAFAALAIHPKLNEQVNVFIALAPAMSPAGLSNGVVDALVKASPQVVYLLFGRRSILSSATMWQSVLYPPLFVRAVDVGMSFLFGWRTLNISVSQKLAAYPHLYSYTSTKSVVHWFQIIRTKSFQMYDDDVHPPLALLHSRHTKVAKYPTRNIRTPVVLVYGGSDSLVDIRAMLRELPAQTVATEIPHYEHLDFLWARDVDVQVFRHVFDALDSFPGAEHTQEEYARYRSARHTSLSASQTLGGGGRSSSSSLRLRRHGYQNSDAEGAEGAEGVEGVPLPLPSDRTPPPVYDGLDALATSMVPPGVTPSATPAATPAATPLATPVAERPSPIPPILRRAASQRFQGGIQLGSSKAAVGDVTTEAVVGVRPGTPTTAVTTTTVTTTTAAAAITSSSSSSDEGKTTETGTLRSRARVATAAATAAAAAAAAPTTTA